MITDIQTKTLQTLQRISYNKNMVGARLIITGGSTFFHNAGTVLLLGRI